MPDRPRESQASLAQTAASLPPADPQPANATNNKEAATPDGVVASGDASDGGEVRQAAPIEMSQARRLVIFLSLALTMLLGSLDFTIVTTAIPKISLEFHALSEATWIATAYMLTTTALQPLYGRLSDTFGRT
ncbi:hypothetical protein H4R19_001633, partial [Coemansia spiralis]